MQSAQIEGYRVSPQQKYLWSLQRRGETDAYCIVGVIKITGCLDRELLRAALDLLVRRHEILRTVYQCLPGVTIPLQVIEEPCSVPLTEVDLGALTLEAQATCVETLFAEAGQAPFDLEHGPLVRAALLVCSPEDQRLLLSVHALCADGYTLQHLAAEIGRCYETCRSGAEPNDEPLQYANIAEWRHEILASEQASEESLYWQQLDLSTVGRARLPFELQPDDQAVFRPRGAPIALEPHTLAQLLACAEHHNTTLEVLLLACWQIVLSRFTERSELCIGLSCSGRAYEDLKQVLGPLEKFVPLCCASASEQPFAGFLGQVGLLCRRIRERQEYFAWEQTAIGSALDDVPARLPFCFEFHAPSSYRGAENLAFALDRQSACTERFTLKLSCMYHEDGAPSLAITLYYDPARVEGADIAGLATAFSALVADAVRDATAPISQLRLLRPQEAGALLTALRGVRAPYPATCIQQLFEAQVERTPDRRALVADGQALTYAALNRRANATGTCPAAARGATGYAGRPVRRALAGADRRATGHPQGRGRLRPARSAGSQGAPGAPTRGAEGPDHRDPGAAPGPPGRAPRRPHLPRSR